ARLEILAAGREDRPHCHPLLLRIVFLAPMQHCPLTLIREAEVRRVPLPHRAWMFRLEENAADAQNAALLRLGGGSRRPRLLLLFFFHFLFLGLGETYPKQQHGCEVRGVKNDPIAHMRRDYSMQPKSRSCWKSLNVAIRWDEFYMPFLAQRRM